MKYYRSMNGFIKIVYDSDYSKLNSKSTKDFNPIEHVSIKSTPSILKLINAYVELMNLNLLKMQ